MSKAMSVALFGLVAFVVVAQSQPLSNVYIDAVDTYETANDGGKTWAVEGASNGDENKSHLREKRAIEICVDILQKLFGAPPCGHQEKRQDDTTIVFGDENVVGNHYEK